MSIRAWEYLDEYSAERSEILAAVDRVFASGTLILGPSVRRFEAEFSAYCGVEHGIGVDNATNGIALALKALGVGAGDEVITVANTAVPTAAAIVQAGAVPRFVDIDFATCLMDARLVEAAITPRTRALLPVHLYGLCVDMDAIGAIARRRKLPVIEDCAQSHGAVQWGYKAGSRSDIGVFSFYPTKPLGAYGDGGMIVTGDSHLAARLRSLRFYGMNGSYYSEEPGYNSRLDEVQAEILRCKLGHLDEYLRLRRNWAARYGRILAGTSLRLPVVPEDNEHAYHLYVVRHPDRDRIVAELKKRDIHLAVHYPYPIHTMRGFAHLGGAAGDLPHTETHARQVFSLPLYPTLTEEKQDAVCQALGEILREPVGL